MSCSKLYAVGVLALCTALGSAGSAFGDAGYSARNQRAVMDCRVMSFNIRVKTSSDGPNQWMFRRDAVAAMLADRKPDVFGLQEATKPQIDDLVDRVGGYARVGIGRLGGDEGEFSPIFYRVDRFDLLEHGNFWLSDTPEEPKMGWDAAYVRNATWAKLRDRRNGRAILFLNTHLDNKGELARTEGARLVMRRIAALAGGLPVIVTGDFNCGPDTTAYRAMSEGPGALRDARVCSRDGHSGPIETFTGFWGGNRKPQLIDYVFVSPGLTVVRTETLADDWQGRQLSDHRALVADVQLP